MPAILVCGWFALVVLVVVGGIFVLLRMAESESRASFDARDRQDAGRFNGKWEHDTTDHPWGV